MTRLLILATILLSIVSFASAQFVKELNTLIGPITQGAKVSVTWSLLDNVDATGKTGVLSAQDTTTKNTITIEQAVPLTPPNYLWTVSVPPGTYNLGLNDGAGLKQSGEVVVVAGKVAPGAPAPAPAPGAKDPAPAPAKDAAPAPAPGAPAPAPAKDAPAKDATPKDTATPSAPGSSGPSSAPPSISSPTGTSTNSASSIFSGYEVVFGLLSVAIAMVQF